MASINHIAFASRQQVASYCLNITSHRGGVPKLGDKGNFVLRNIVINDTSNKNYNPMYMQIVTLIFEFAIAYGDNLSRLRSSAKVGGGKVFFSQLKLSVDSIAFIKWRYP